MSKSEKIIGLLFIALLLIAFLSKLFNDVPPTSKVAEKPTPAYGDFFIVDDFEDYNYFEPSNIIFKTWKDGWGIVTNGSMIGYPDPNLQAGEHFVETRIVHSGSQSMPYFFDNTISGNSEAAMTLSYPRDWTEEEIRILTLWFFGDPKNAPEPMYVALSNSTGSPAIVYHDDPNAALINTWTKWNIDLEVFSDQGVSLTNVDKIAIGFGDRNIKPPSKQLDIGLKDFKQPHNVSKIYFDDIQLHRLP